jgi:hypothetical protein
MTMLSISSREKQKYMAHILLWGHKLMMLVGSKCPKIQFTFKHNKIMYSIRPILLVASMDLCKTEIYLDTSITITYHIRDILTLKIYLMTLAMVLTIFVQLCMV